MVAKRCFVSSIVIPSFSLPIFTLHIGSNKDILTQILALIHVSDHYRLMSRPVINKATSNCVIQNSLQNFVASSWY